jgi:hypothetical protein
LGTQPQGKFPKRERNHEEENMTWLKNFLTWLAVLLTDKPPSPAPAPPSVKPDPGGPPPPPPADDNQGPPAPDAAGGRDQIDPATVQWLHPSAAGFKVTASLGGIDILGKRISWAWLHPRWPSWRAPTPPDAQPAPEVVGNLWVFGKIKGQWRASTLEWLRSDTATCLLQARDDQAPFVQTKAPLFDEWRPAPGEEIGFMVSTICRGGIKPAGSPRERSPIVLVRYPG